MESKLKPTFEKIDPIFGSSFYLDRFVDKSCHEKPQWHFHPEYEIVYIPDGDGKRHIGNHIGRYEDGELILLGPNLPHLSYSAKSREIVLQLREDFLGTTFLNIPEMNAIKQLFARGRTGVVFIGETKHKIGSILNSLIDEPPFERLLGLFKALQMMATTDDYESLNASGFAVEVNPQDKVRMEAIYHHVEHNFQRVIPLEEVAQLINMTVPAFCRYFKKLTNRTFTQMVNEFRITYASRLLQDEHMSIAAISFESGFNNLSHFNKQFRQITGVSPREYRKNLRKLVN
ncbi:MAG: AraC family transcriptional regulator [Bacteroidota bacterium]